MPRQLSTTNTLMICGTADAPYVAEFVPEKCDLEYEVVVTPDLSEGKKMLVDRTQPSPDPVYNMTVAAICAAQIGAAKAKESL